MGASTIENNMEVPQKIKIELPYDPASTSGYLSDGNKNTNSKIYMHVHCSIIYNRQDMETT